jgi:hypothetical protein
MNEFKPVLSIERLNEFRSTTFRLLPDRCVTSAEEAVHFVNERGFIFFWPIKGVLLPSLWAAAAGDRPVPDEHDDPGHVTWGWKDNLLGKKEWYYSRVLRRRNTIISLQVLPYFYALSPNFGDFETDYLEQYEQGRMTLEAKCIYETILSEGPIDTITLRKAARLSNPGSESRFNRALDDLQIEFKILPVGVAKAGSWRYAFLYDITPRHFPSLQGDAQNVSIETARRKLLDYYLLSVGGAEFRDITRLFGWKQEDALQAIRGLKVCGKLVDEVTILDHGTQWVVTSALI